MRSGKRRKDQTSQLDEMNILNARVDSLETERERLRRQIETMSSQNRHVHSQQWTTEQVADAHADMLKTALKGLNVIKSTTRFCQTFNHPIVDSLARCLDDGNFVFHLAMTVRDLIGTQNTSKDDVYNEAAEVYAATLSDCLRIGFVRERLHQRAEIIEGFFNALFTLEPDDYGRQVKLRDKVTECLFLLHSDDAERKTTRLLYEGDVLDKMGFFINHDDVSPIQQANMVRGK